MRVMIATADKSTVSGIASYLRECGHNSESARNGVECMAVLRRFVPDLLVMEFDILWGGCDGVMAVMNDDPQLKHVPVVLFRESHKQLEPAAYPRIIASLARSYQPLDLNRLNELLENVNPNRIDNTFFAKCDGQCNRDRYTACPGASQSWLNPPGFFHGFFDTLQQPSM